jgi:hypothetical protein
MSNLVVHARGKKTKNECTEFGGYPPVSSKRFGEKFGLMTKAGGKTEECWRKGAMIWRKGAVHIWGGRHGTRLPLKYGSNFDP